jgi:hypothetical protein
VNHHIKEEEGEMFPQLGRAKADWQSLCDEMNSRREELMQQLMPGGESSEAAGASRTRTSRSRGGDAEQRAQAASQGQSDDEK